MLSEDGARMRLFGVILMWIGILGMHFAGDEDDVQPKVAAIFGAFGVVLYVVGLCASWSEETMRPRQVLRRGLTVISIAVIYAAASGWLSAPLDQMSAPGQNDVAFAVANYVLARVVVLVNLLLTVGIGAIGASMVATAVVMRSTSGGAPNSERMTTKPIAAPPDPAPSRKWLRPTRQNGNRRRRAAR